MNESAIRGSVKGWLLAAAVAVVPVVGFAAPAAPSLEAAAGQAAAITRQAKDFAARKAQEARGPKALPPKFALDVSGTVRAKEWRLVYSGQYEKCYTIRFTERQGVPGSPESYRQPTIMVYANGQHVENLSHPGESTDVCGTKIQLTAWAPYDEGTCYFQAVERRP